MLDNYVNVSNLTKFEREKIKEKLNLHLESLINMNSKLQAFDSSNSLWESNSKNVVFITQSGRSLKRNPIYANPNFVNFHDDDTILNSLGKRKKIEDNVELLSGEMEGCSIILQNLMNHKHGWMFNEPVDAMKLCIPDYHMIIKNPMDFGTINNKLKTFLYSNAKEFAMDVRLTFSNAFIYNPIGHFICKMAQTLSSLFENQWNKIIMKNPTQVETKVKKPTSKVKFPITHIFIVALS